MRGFKSLLPRQVPENSRKALFLVLFLFLFCKRHILREAFYLLLCPTNPLRQALLLALLLALPWGLPLSSVLIAAWALPISGWIYLCVAESFAWRMISRITPVARLPKAQGAPLLQFSSRYCRAAAERAPPGTANRHHIRE